MPGLKETLVEFRKNNELNQKQMARYVGIGYRTYQSIEATGKAKKVTDIEKINAKINAGTMDKTKIFADEETDKTEQKTKASNVPLATTVEMSAMFIELMRKLESIEFNLQNNVSISQDSNSLARSTLLQLARQEAESKKGFDPNEIFERSLQAAKELLSRTYGNARSRSTPAKKKAVQ